MPSSGLGCWTLEAGNIVPSGEVGEPAAEVMPKGLLRPACYGSLAGQVALLAGQAMPRDNGSLQRSAAGNSNNGGVFQRARRPCMLAAPALPHTVYNHLLWWRRNSVKWCPVNCDAQASLLHGGDLPQAATANLLPLNKAKLSLLHRFRTSALGEATQLADEAKINIC
ncbi:hypothetical protein SNOG_11593 [Parastagonospora nodorum SN15]|uniref:Uncharacterized protein n=1 Tax=Phaeosphaeria nodorum (strain SN15 / ATCC MYA-4574 / FGSC 10173) TaxID=321614 RepID=Q0U9H1_PHANO|nr:hypothetical protein SNOG_11593 [Parastagonospora nodorum SN15]EAT81301.1 hypothetical protein SNOG_11593 [Parastagonospora nodorum SN15]